MNINDIIDICDTIQLFINIYKNVIIYQPLSYFSFKHFIVSLRCLVSVPQHPDKIFIRHLDRTRSSQRSRPNRSGSPVSRVVLLFSSLWLF